jgi:hypothetical protein
VTPSIVPNALKQYTIVNLLLVLVHSIEDHKLGTTSIVPNALTQYITLTSLLVLAHSVGDHQLGTPLIPTLNPPP